MTEKQKRFCEEYLIDLNATQAAIRAGYSEKTANRIASENLTKPDIQKALQKASESRSKRTEITQDMVLRRWWDISEADPNEIIQVRRTCCRNCYGVDYKYQWRDREEYARVVNGILAAHKDGDKEPVLPSDEGGYGFDRLKDPNPDCPYCRGEGMAEVHLADTRRLKGRAKRLYAGVKQTATGIEIKFRDQDKALENVAKHLGMFTEKVELSGGVKIELEGELKDWAK